MIKEIDYNQKTILDPKDTNCYIHFYLGENAFKYLKRDLPNKLLTWKFINEVEQEYNINVNLIDLSFIFDNLDKINLPIDESDLDKLIDLYKQIFKNSIKLWLGC